MGTITLNSNQTLFLDEGAVVYACVEAIDAENISILGRGILDNSHNKEEILFECNEENNDMAIDNAIRKHTVQLEYCTNVRIDGITIRDSLVYNIRPIGCKNLHISNVKIIGCWRYNSDGIDMHNCEDVLLENCFLRTFDDAICVKGFDCFYEGDVEKAVHDAMYRNGKAYDVFKNVAVKNYTIWNDWGKGLEIGAETRAEEIFNIVFEDCDIIHVLGNALDCYSVDYANIHDVIYQNINVEYDDIIPHPDVQTHDSEIYKSKNSDFAPSLICVGIEFHPEYSDGGNRRGINHDITFKNIHLSGRHKPSLLFKGYDDEHKTKDITIENLYWNERLITDFSEVDYAENDYVENVRITVSDYSQAEKNTVDSKNQLDELSYIRFFNADGKGKRILFAGNSITLHGILPKIGWYNECGMAASSAEKDYAHLLMAKTQEKDSDAAFCICQVSSWESDFINGESHLPMYEVARKFNADIIVMRFIENCYSKFDSEIFKTEAMKLLGYLNPDNKAKIILTTGFWHHAGDAAVADLSREYKLPMVTLGDLGEKDEMKAIGLFEHEGVANHPGDLGMKHIADRIWTELEKLL